MLHGDHVNLTLMINRCENNLENCNASYFLIFCSYDNNLLHMGLRYTLHKHENVVCSRIVKRRDLEHREQRCAILLCVSTNQIYQRNSVSSKKFFRKNSCHDVTFFEGTLTVAL